MVENRKQQSLIRGLNQAISDFANYTGKEPELILMGADMFWDMSRSPVMRHYPHLVVEYDGIRVLTSPGLTGKIILVEKMHEVPLGYFPEIVENEK